MAVPAKTHCDPQQEDPFLSDSCKTILSPAMSLDGYIADQRDSTAWHGNFETNEEEDSYSQFIRTIGTIFMGWNTWRQITEELSPETWPYSDQTAYVFTHHPQKSSGQIRFTDEDPRTLLETFRQPAKISGSAALPVLQVSCLKKMSLMFTGSPLLQSFLEMEFVCLKSFQNR